MDELNASSHWTLHNLQPVLIVWLITSSYVSLCLQQEESGRRQQETGLSGWHILWLKCAQKVWKAAAAGSVRLFWLDAVAYLARISAFLPSISPSVHPFFHPSVCTRLKVVLDIESGKLQVDVPFQLQMCDKCAARARQALGGIYRLLWMTVVGQSCQSWLTQPELEIQAVGKLEGFKLEFSNFLNWIGVIQGSC